MTPRHAIPLALLLAILSAGCAQKGSTNDPEAFERLIAEYLEYHWSQHPEEATGAGIHRYDDRLHPASAEEYAARGQRLGRFLERAQAFRAAPLGRDQEVDRRLLVSDLRVRLAQIERVRKWERDPGLYIPFDALNDLVTGDFAPLKERARNLLARLEEVPRLLEEGEANLKRPPRLFTQIAMGTARRMVPFYRENLKQFAAKVPSLQGRLEAARLRALQALEHYRAFLEKEVLPRSDGSLALGRELYDFYLHQYHMLDEDADSLLARGERDFQEAARAIDHERSWQEITREIRSHHPTREGLLDAYCREIERAREHVRSHHLVTLPPDGGVRCLWTPPSQRAFSPFGDFRTPAPFSREKIGYFILHPIPEGLDPKEEERLLRAHDETWIQVIAPHESYPGHHLQALKAQENPRLFRKVYQSPLFSEGWGLYSEQLMYETGFFRNPKATRLTQLRLRLWRAARVILDVKLHTGQMSYDEARHFLEEKIRFEPSATAGEVNIYVFRPSYAISYMVGYREIMRLRREYRQKMGSRFSLRAFHDALLTQGSIPFKLVRELLL